MINDYLIIIGNNFISDYLYSEYKRNEYFKVINTTDINKINSNSNYIIDCSFDLNIQNNTINYCNEHNVNKLLIINHWCIKVPKISTIIIQAIIYDVYGNEHNSFNRQSVGNNYDDVINYCSLISESIRRIHDAKNNFLPITYIPYVENEIKYINIENLYHPINYMFTFNKNVAYSIYENIKTIENVVYTVKNVLDYNGQVYTISEERTFKNVPKLNYNYKYTNLNTDIKKIYNYLLNCNERFIKNKEIN